MKKLIALSLMSTLILSCESMKNSSEKTIKAYIGSCFKVSLFSGGKPVFEDYAEYVNAEYKTDGWYFKDINGKFIRLSGDVLVEEVDDKYCEGK